MKHEMKFRKYEDEDRQSMKFRDRERKEARKAKTVYFRSENVNTKEPRR